MRLPFPPGDSSEAHTLSPSVSRRLVSLSFPIGRLPRSQPWIGIEKPSVTKKPGVP